jgi:hypothetical protein
MSDFNWTFTTLATETVGDLRQVVRTVDWRLTYVPTGDIISGTAQLGDPAPLGFTPFAELTADHVQVWVEQSLDLDAVQAIVSRAKSPPPWSAT